MSRRLARTALGSLAALALAAPLTQVAGADEPTGQRAPAVGEVGYALIQGKVVDAETGRAIDDVAVQATRQKAVKGVTGASDLSYASPDNAIKHGYFAMHVPHGTYTVTFSKKGYRSVTQEVRRKKEQQGGLGEVELVPLRETRVAVGGVGSNRRLSFVEGQDVTIKIQVKARGEGNPTGRLTVLAGGPKGDEVARTDLGRSDKGVVVLGLGKAKGSGRVPYTVVYSGDDDFLRSEQGFTVQVRRG